MIARRGFLGLFAAAAVLDPEKLLWRPGAKLISIPAPPLPVTWRGPVLAIGDIVTIGDWPDRYIVTAEAQTWADIEQARFAPAGIDDGGHRAGRLRFGWHSDSAA